TERRIEQQFHNHMLKQATPTVLDALGRLQRALPALLIVALAVVALFSSDQGKDILHGAIDDNALMARLIFSVFAVCVVGGTCVSTLADVKSDYILPVGVAIGAFGFFLFFNVLMPDGFDDSAWKALRYLLLGTFIIGAVFFLLGGASSKVNSRVVMCCSL